jgi:hypothetical protein
MRRSPAGQFQFVPLPFIPLPSGSSGGFLDFGEAPVALLKIANHTPTPLTIDAITRLNCPT